MADLFKIATKRKYRFNYKGHATVEDLWDLSVEELDKIYKNLKSLQKNASEESLLQTVTKEDKELNNKIEIIKTIVTDKLAAKDRAMKAASQRAQNQRILEIMADKQDAALKEKSIEELQNMLITEDIEDDE
jgi:tryptophan 2,3-dioxygenase